MSDDSATANAASIPALDLQALAQAIGRTAQASAVFGEAVHQDDVTIIPVARAAWGLGRGGRDARNGGGGLRMEPVGFIEVRKGVAAFRSIRRKRLPLALPLAIFALALTRRALGREDRAVR